ncbi:hypothetical protein CLAFUW4_03216 [Fulvia fulva]|uniref:NTF2-like domain-containing protein n=1 Tax=Passalora fulva TaxID=5499 RepID=A0A9Q8L9X1_PASFU|nr:uncharacterized protein CLAFUR5_03199 [Fulvia fulva]UJO13404.1 hypothetical protein CLAFUR5_03199 [Fulvia fulva]WPV11903.1 hypothetical protein CLAFUW4_03216 [Fulvia fulva]
MAISSGVHMHAQCISQSEARSLVAKFVGILGRTDRNAASTAQTILTQDFKEYSNSIFSLKGQSLTSSGLVASSRQAYLEEIGGAPAPPRGIETLDIIASCDKVVWFWISQNVGSGLQPVRGFNLFKVKRNRKGQWQAYSLDVEFDSIAWGVDIGIKVTYQNGTVVPK